MEQTRRFNVGTRLAVGFGMCIVVVVTLSVFMYSGFQTLGKMQDDGFKRAQDLQKMLEADMCATELYRIAADAEIGRGVPVTYVPARNTIFLSLALALAEVARADDIFAGMNAVDFSGYPDCRPQYIEAYERMANLATKRAVEGSPLAIHTPIIHLAKAEIIRRGVALGVDFSMTVSCYQADDGGRACGKCDACRLRSEGFASAGIADPTRYA